MCSLDPLNVLPFDKPIYIYIYKYESSVGTCGLLYLKFDGRNMKFEVYLPIKNGCQKNNKQDFNQSVIIKITPKKS